MELKPQIGIDNIKFGMSQNEVIEILGDLKVSEHIPRQPGDVPSVLLFEMQEDVDYVELKKELWSMGVHCSKFYGREAFYVPCHQQSSTEYMEMIKDILKHFMHDQRN